MASAPSNQEHIIGYLKSKFSHWVEKLGQDWLEDQLRKVLHPFHRSDHKIHPRRLRNDLEEKEGEEEKNAKKKQKTHRRRSASDSIGSDPEFGAWEGDKAYYYPIQEWASEVAQQQLQQTGVNEGSSEQKSQPIPIPDMFTALWENYGRGYYPDGYLFGTPWATGPYECSSSAVPHSWDTATFPHVLDTEHQHGVSSVEPCTIAQQEQDPNSHVPTALLVDTLPSQFRSPGAEAALYV